VMHGKNLYVCKPLYLREPPKIERTPKLGNPKHCNFQGRN
jgi:hypothetical protein